MQGTDGVQLTFSSEFIKLRFVRNNKQLNNFLLLLKSLIEVKDDSLLLHFLAIFVTPNNHQ